MNRKTFVVLLLVGMIISTLVSCKKDDCQCKKIRIGALFPIDGSASPQGQDALMALMVAKTDINQYLKEFYNGTEVEVIVKNTLTLEEAAITRYQELKEEGVRLVVGPYTSAELNAVKPYADRDGILLVSPASIVTSLSIAGDNILRMVPDLNGQAEALNALLMADGIKALVPVVRDDIWGNELLDATASIFTANGNQVFEATKYQPDANMATVASDLNSKINEALASFAVNEVGIYMICYDEGTSIIRHFAYYPSVSDARWYGSSGYAFDPYLLLDNAVTTFASNRNFTCPIFGFDPVARPKWEPLMIALQAETGKIPDIYAFAAYDALWLATFTFLKTGDKVDIENLREQFISEAENYFGVTGWTALNEAGDRAWATYDFWGIKWQLNEPVWSLVANYNNGSGILTRY